MMTFQQFLTEKFLKGFKGIFKYTELYKNPAPSELTEFAPAEHLNIPYDLREYGTTGYYCAGLIVGRDLFVWSRAASDHVGVIRELNTSVDKCIPLYLYYLPDTKTLAVDLAIFTAGEAPMGKFRKPSVLVDYCRKHPAFRLFKNIVPVSL